MSAVWPVVLLAFQWVGSGGAGLHQLFTIEGSCWDETTGGGTEGHWFQTKLALDSSTATFVGSCSLKQII